MAKAIRVYTKHGLRAHYLNPEQSAAPAAWLGRWRDQTFCGHAGYALSERSRFFRRRLAQASVCAVCEAGEEAL